MKIKKLLLILIILVLVAAGGFVMYGKFQEFQEFSEKIDTLVASAAQFTDYEDFTVHDGEPYRKGKIFIVDYYNKEEDRLYYSLTLDIRAQAIDEVETVVLIKWNSRLEGYYVSESTKKYSGDAFRAIGNVIVLDWNQKKIVDQKEFVGQEPPQVIRTAGDYETAKPAAAILKYINSLPAGS